MYFSGKTVLITGGTGFIGRYISRYLIKITVGRVCILSRDWHKQMALRTELGDPENFRWFIGDIRDRDRLLRAFNGVDYIIHAAALKDIVSSEYSPREALLTNCIGTQNVIDAAIDCGVKKVLFLSSDKGVLASSCYGRSKALSENLITASNSYSPGKTLFSSLRYGNVVGSSSSVVEIFLRQKESGKITVTDSNMTRFWIAPQQAVELIFTCLKDMQGGEIFVPHLPSAPIMQIASAIAPDAQIEIVGIRPGEKMHELMISPEESHRACDVGWAYRITPEFNFWGASYPGGSPVPEGWAYSSASAQRLTDDELKAILQ